MRRQARLHSPRTLRRMMIAYERSLIMVDRPGVAPDFRLYNRSTSNNQQNLTYGYDPVGNVLSIADALFTGTRTFTYDDLNRLSTAYGTFGQGQALQTAVVYELELAGLRKGLLKRTIGSHVSSRISSRRQVWILKILR